ncbi:acyltransferase [Nocardiopsis sp. FIRDI 009]|uniref:acyltransferase family protein n=1 Tax=Nocardiopsis sp. FIRDI 009 TaxID=714197 RepID=UPI000E27486F|nr:acyltransferase [Nocardiopsis sp. FIRDI 009]
MPRTWRPRTPAVLTRIRETARSTPERRDRYVDLLRALAIVFVVLGHWLAVVVTTDDGIAGRNALGILSWTRPMTWLFQVMPVFFLVGGYANAASLASHREKGGDSLGWVLGRTDRLLRPTTAFLAAVWAVALGALLLGTPPELVGLATWAAAIPLWFLAAYLGVVVLAPLMHGLHRRWGAAVPSVLIGVVLALDVARLGLDVPFVGNTNYLLVWLALHQLGFLWRDRRAQPRPLAAAAAALGGFALLLALTVPGPYPTSMVTVPGQALGNTSPPTFALLVLGLTQTAVVLWLASPARRMLRRPGPWTAVVAVNAVVLTVFLWHMSAAVIAGAALYGTGLLTQWPVGSAAWLLQRVPWLVAVALVLAVLVVAFGGVEARTAPSSAGWRISARVSSPITNAAWRALIVSAMAAMLAGLTGIALTGVGQAGVSAFSMTALGAYAVGASALRLARRHWSGS